MDSGWRTRLGSSTPSTRQPARRVWTLVAAVATLCATIGVLVPATAASAASPPMTFSAPVQLTGLTLNGISCASTSLCVAVGAEGSVFVTVNPTATSPTWQSADVDGTNTLTGISCPTSSLCVAIDNVGNVITSTNPSGGSGAWTVTNVDPGQGLIAISCQGTLCVAVDDVDVVTTLDALGGAAQWTVTPLYIPIAGIDFTGVSCPTSSSCVAVNNSGGAAISSNPTGGSTAWTFETLDTSSDRPLGVPLAAVSCPSSSLCVAVDIEGDLVTSTDPVGGTSPWTRAVIGPPFPYVSLTAVSCSSTPFCVAVDAHGIAHIATNPTGGPSAWTTTGIDAKNDVTGISCPTSSLCVATDSGGSVVVGSPPPVPTVTSVSPNTGPTTGGTSITITGTGFIAGATVTIGQGTGAVTGAISATNVKVVSSTEITATTGGGAKAGPWNLFVTTSGGTSPASTGDNFTYH